MTWSTVQHTETLTPSSILIFQGAFYATGFLFSYMVPERLFQKSDETQFVSEFCYFAKKSYGSRWDPRVWIPGDPGSLWDPRGAPYGVTGYGSLGTRVPMGSQGMDPLNTTKYHKIPLLPLIYH